jgi:hypothetical protein
MRSLHELRLRLRGLVAPIVTPFDDNGAVSLSGLRQVLEFVVEAGVAAVIPGDLVGEFFSLTLEERRLLLQESVNVAGSRIVVIALTADASLDNAIALAQFAQRAGADVIKLALPYPYTPPEPVILSYFRKLADAVELPFIVESSDELEIPLTVIEVLCDIRDSPVSRNGSVSVASTNSTASSRNASSSSRAGSRRCYSFVC